MPLGSAFALPPLHRHDNGGIRTRWATKCRVEKGTAMIATLFDAHPVYETIAKLSGAIALWASLKAQTPIVSGEDAYKQLELRIRHPWQYRRDQIARWLR